MVKLQKVLNSNQRYIDDVYYGQRIETQTAMTCCVCNCPIWIEVKSSGNTVLREAFKVVDARVYADGVIPQYLTQSNVLKECHFKCKLELERQLSEGEFGVVFN